MQYLLLIHLMIIGWLLIDGHNRKIKIMPWAIGTLILGPIILPQYITSRPLKNGECGLSRYRQGFFRKMAVFWTILLLMVSIWGGKTFTRTINDRGEALEYQLAVINNKDYVSENEGTVAHFRIVLNQLSQSYNEDHKQIADLSLIVHDRLSKAGIKESLLNIMEGLSLLLWPEYSKKQSYAECVLAYVELRTKGLSHQEAIDSLQAIINGY